MSIDVNKVGSVEHACWPGMITNILGAVGGGGGGGRGGRGGDLYKCPPIPFPASELPTSECTPWMQQQSPT